MYLNQGYFYIAGKKRSRIVAETALGKPLPRKAVVHHVDEDKENDSPDNLVICENTAYHALIHLRLNALRAAGDPHFRKCHYCGIYDKPENLFFGSQKVVHLSCNTNYNRQRASRIKRERG